MRTFKIIAAVATSTAFFAAPASAGPADDATGFVTKIIDQFNGGDAKAFVSAHADNAVIVDEFGQHVWTGPGTAQHWLDDYTKFSAAEGQTGGKLSYGKPLQATSDGATAYIVLPTTYSYVQKGTKMAEPGNMTLVVKRDGANWKIVSWAYAGGTAAPAK